MEADLARDLARRLEAMKRAELQTLAKSHGVKANTKSQQIIADLLPVLVKVGKDLPPGTPQGGKENTMSTPSNFGTPLSSFTNGDGARTPLSEAGSQQKRPLPPSSPTFMLDKESLSLSALAKSTPPRIPSRPLLASSPAARQAGAILKLSPLATSSPVAMSPAAAAVEPALVLQPAAEPAATSTFIVSDWQARTSQIAASAGPGRCDTTARASVQLTASVDLPPEAGLSLSRSSSHAHWHAQQEEQAKDLLNSLAALKLSRAGSRRSSVAVSQTMSGRPSDVPTPEFLAKPTPTEQPAAAAAAAMRSVSPQPASLQRRTEPSAAAPKSARPVSPAPASAAYCNTQAGLGTATAAPGHQHIPGASPFRGLSNALRASGPSLTPTKAATRMTAPMVSPLRMPARRVAPAAPAAASEGQAALEKLVEQQCLSRPTSATVKHMVGMDQLWTQLCSDLELPPASPAPLASARAGAKASSQTVASSSRASSGAVRMRSALVYGPPNNGKSLAVYAAAARHNARCFTLDCHKLLTSKALLDNCADVVKTVFTLARRPPEGAFVVVEHLEALHDAAATGALGERAAEAAFKLRTELLVQLDSLHYSTTASTSTAAGSKSGASSTTTGAPTALVVVGITSTPCSVDDTLAACFVAPGRALGTRASTGGGAGSSGMPGPARAAGVALYAPLPSPDTREEVMVMDMCGRNAALSVADMEELVRATEGLACGDVVQLCAAAAAAAGSGAIALHHFRSALAACGQAPRLTHAAAIAYLKWKSVLC